MTGDGTEKMTGQRSVVFLILFILPNPVILLSPSTRALAGMANSAWPSSPAVSPPEATRRQYADAPAHLVDRLDPGDDLARVDVDILHQAAVGSRCR